MSGQWQHPFLLFFVFLDFFDVFKSTPKGSRRLSFAKFQRRPKLRGTSPSSSSHSLKLISRWGQEHDSAIFLAKFVGQPERHSSEFGCVGPAYLKGREKSFSGVSPAGAGRGADNAHPLACIFVPSRVADIHFSYE